MGGRRGKGKHVRGLAQAACRKEARPRGTDHQLGVSAVMHAKAGILSRRFDPTGRNVVRPLSSLAHSRLS